KNAPAKEAPAEQPKAAAKAEDKGVNTAAASGDQNDPKSRYTAIVETRFMAGVKEFQQWMGDSHPVTGTGLPKRADIQHVAANIGMDAESIANNQDPAVSPSYDTDLSVPAGPQPTRYGQYAQAIPELISFREALQASTLISVLSTKAHPGSRAKTFGFVDLDQI